MLPEFGERLHKASEKIVKGAEAAQRGFETGRAIRSDKPTDFRFVDHLKDRGVKGVAEYGCTITDTMLGYMWKLHQDPTVDFNLFIGSSETVLPGYTAGRYLMRREIFLRHAQNSGGGYLIDGATSFEEVYGIPGGTILTYRGADPERDPSWPHIATGRKTRKLAKLLTPAGKDVYGSEKGIYLMRSLDKMLNAVFAGRQSVLLLPDGSFDKTYDAPVVTGDVYPHVLDPEVRAKKGTMWEDYLEREAVSRDEAIKEIVRRNPDAVKVFSNGYTSRAALKVADSLSNFYIAGYMGGEIAVGVGMAEADRTKKVVVITGDQAAGQSKMHEILEEDYPENLEIFVLHNGTGASVGGTVPSRRTPSWTFNLMHVVQTIPDKRKSFEYDRVEKGLVFDKENAELLARELGSPLEKHTERFMSWIEQDRVRRSVDRLLEQSLTS